MQNPKTELLPTAAPSLRKPLQFLRAALSHASGALIVVAALLGVARAAGVVLGPWVMGDGEPVKTLYRLLSSELLAGCMLIGVLIAEQFVRNGARRLAAYAPTVAVAAVISGLICAPVILFMNRHGVPMNTPYERFGMFGTWLYFSADGLARGGLAAFVYANRSSLLASIRELRAAELDRARTARDLANSRLAAVEAIIQPEALISTLKTLRTLYEEDDSEADLKLAAFIEQLRTITLGIRA